MEKPELLLKLGDIFEDLFGIDSSEVNRETSPDSIAEWDSLKHVQLISSIEENFGIILTAEEQADMLNVDLILDILSERKP